MTGFWSKAWHDYFRLGFHTASVYLATKLTGSSHVHLTRHLRLWIGFGLSGYMHASGAWMMNPNGNPIRGEFKFYLLQALGSSIQVLVATHVGGLKENWGYLGKISNLSFSIGWLIWTGPYLNNDLIRGGFWD